MIRLYFLLRRNLAGTILKFQIILFNDETDVLATVSVLHRFLTTSFAQIYFQFTQGCMNNRIKTIMAYK